MSDYELQALTWNGWEVIYTARNKREALVALGEYDNYEEMPLRIKKARE